MIQGCRNFSGGLIAVAVLAALPLTARAETTWRVGGGTTTFAFDVERLEETGITVDVADGEFVAALPTANSFAIDAASTFEIVSVDGVMDHFGSGRLVHEGGLSFQSASGRVDLDRLPIGASVMPGYSGLFLMADRTSRIPVPLLEVGEIKAVFDQIGQMFMVETGALRMTQAMADALGVRELAGMEIGELVIRGTLAWVDGDEPLPFAPTEVAADEGSEDDGALRGSPACGQAGGADVIVGVIPDISNTTGQTLSGIDYDTFAVGTTSCNVGDAQLLWDANQNTHPVIGQSFYRLHNGRFEQLAQAWLKHGFTALQQNACSCGCQSSGTGTRLGIGCSDPYCSGLNFGQSSAGPKWQVNAWTGAFTYPPANPAWSGSTARRMHVICDEIDSTVIGAGALYFVEGQYVTPDDAAAGNQNNNASYRAMTVSGSGAAWTFALAGSTVRGEEGIRAWKDTDATVTETDIQVPSEGLFIVSAKATSLGGGVFHYEYAVQNLNSDRSAKSFGIPVEAGATVTNIGFRDVPYWDGDGDGSVTRDGTNWTSAHAGGAVTWNMVDLAGTNDNALRWGTLYNFRFDVNRASSTGNCTIGLYKTGSPTSASGSTVVPLAGPQDCNGNGIADSTDITNGTSQDCNTNGVPDECETFTVPTLGAQQVACGLTTPVGIYHSLGDATRLFIVEQTGRIKIYNRTTSTVNASPFLDLSGIISSGGERGLLGLAFHPSYASNGFFYVNYTNTAGNTVIARYTRTTADTANAGSALILKTITQPFSNHNGGCLQFGPDGMLYCGMGDGGSAGDPNANGQNTGTLLGKMLRLNVNAASPYIPADNPFIAAGNPLDEIWQIGTRNPWRFSFDRLTGDMYIGDVGQDAHEEIDFQPASSTGGENWGWRCYEGNFAYNTTGCGAIGNYDFPILDVPHAGGVCSITGGFVYRGCAMPGLSGTYFYADYCANWIRSFRYDGATLSDQQDRTAQLVTPYGGAVGAIVSFGEDTEGEMYIVSITGCIHKIVPVVPAVCGNGVIEAGETCDDSNTISGDGCSSTCQTEATNNNTCSGATAVCPGSSSGTTSGATQDGTASCGTSSTTADVWYKYTPLTNGTLNVNTCGSNDLGGVDSGRDTVLSIHSACPGSSGNQLACNDDWNSGGLPANACSATDTGTQIFDSAVSIAVTAGTTYIIRVSGFSGNVGNFILNVSGPACGNPITDCNGNGIADATDIANGTSLDCNDDNIPDECQALKTYTIPVSPALAIPDNNATGVFREFTVPDSGTILDLNLGFAITHTWNGDLVVKLTHGATTVTVLDRPGVPASQFGSNDNGFNIILDDEGGGGAIENIDPAGNVGPVVSPPSYTPNNPLSAFDGMNKAGVWRITVSDLAPPDTGSLTQWRLIISNPPLPCPEDCNDNGRDDPDDIACGLGNICLGLRGSGDCNNNDIPDDCEIADGSEIDCDGGPVGNRATGETLQHTWCQGCHNVNGQGGSGPACGGACPGPNKRNRTREFLWNKLRTPTSHAGGAHDEFTAADFANLEAFLADGGSLGRPDEVPDSCQNGLEDCDADTATDGCELENGTQADADYDGVPDDCEGCSTPAECNDGNACTNDDCVGGSCQNSAITCNDGNACTTDTCSPSTGCVYTPIVCNDGNACTTDSCSAGACVFTPLNCNDGNACTTDGCSGGTCTHTAVNCNDGIVCTTDSCNTVTGCSNAPVVCNDGNECTDDSCHPASGQCEFDANSIACDDGDECTTNDVCANLTCEGTAVDCNDGNACTIDACDGAGGCTHDPVVGCCTSAAQCSDGNECTTDDCTGNACTHNAVTCDDSNACTTDSCNTATGCQYDAVVCDDGDACTDDACVGGACEYTAIDCDDDDACTTDSCVNGACGHQPVDCNDDDPCTADSCDSVTGCANDPLPCDTGACCTNGVCTEGTPADCAGFVCDVFDYFPAGFIGCFGDADGNNVVNPGDRGVISANIGNPSYAAICRFDLDGNNVINPGDRGLVSANIGVCTSLPDYQNGSGLNHGAPDTRFPGGGVFQGFGTTCVETGCP